MRAEFENWIVDTVNSAPLVKHGDMVTMDFQEDRVRIFFTSDGRVASKPRRG